jgi:hypothetical protein
MIFVQISSSDDGLPASGLGTFPLPSGVGFSDGLVGASGLPGFGIAGLVFTEDMSPPGVGILTLGVGILTLGNHIRCVKGHLIP